MKISEVSRATGVPLSTVKMYLREGLLQPGEKSQPNQATYGPEHVQRVRLVNGLIRVGGLSVAAAQEVIAAIDSDQPLVQTFGVAQRAATTKHSRESVEDEDLATVDAVTAGWLSNPQGPGRYAAAAAVGAFEAAGQRNGADWYQRLANAAMLVAEADLDLIDTRSGREEKAETVVLGTVLGDALFSGLRRAAQEHVSNTRYVTPGSAPRHAPTGYDARPGTNERT